MNFVRLNRRFEIIDHLVQILLRELVNLAARNSSDLFISAVTFSVAVAEVACQDENDLRFLLLNNLCVRLKTISR